MENNKTSGNPASVSTKAVQSVRNRAPANGDLINAACAKAYLHGSAMPQILSGAAHLLIGKTVRDVGYVVDGSIVSPCIVFTDGTIVVAQSDDEGNGPGVLSVEGNSGSALLCETSLTGGAR